MATNEDTTEAVEGFDVLDSFLTQMEAADAPSEEGEDSPPAEDVDGPGDEPGELPADDSAPEPEDGEPSPEEEDDDDQEPEAEATAPTGPSELDLLRQELAVSRQQQQQLYQMYQQAAAQGQRQRTPAQEAAASGVPEEAIQIALCGGPDSQSRWQQFDKATQQKAQAQAKEYIQRLTRYAVNPEQQYAEQFQGQVASEVQRMVQPLLEDHYARQAKDIFERNASDLIDHKQRVAEVYGQLPGSRSNNWTDLEAAFKVAAALVRNEVQAGGIAAREQKVATSERQKKANRRAARRSRPGGRGKTSPSSNAPKLDLINESLADYADRVSKDQI